MNKQRLFKVSAIIVFGAIIALVMTVLYPVPGGNTLLIRILAVALSFLLALTRTIIQPSRDSLAETGLTVGSIVLFILTCLLAYLLSSVGSSSLWAIYGILFLLFMLMWIGVYCSHGKEEKNEVDYENALTQINTMLTSIESKCLSEQAKSSCEDIKRLIRTVPLTNLVSNESVVRDFLASLSQASAAEEASSQNAALEKASGLLTVIRTMMS